MPRRTDDDDDDDDAEIEDDEESYHSGAVGEALLASVSKTWAEHAQPACSAFEASAVKYIAAAFKPSLLPAVIQHARETSGDPTPTFADLEAVVELLPLRFVVATKLKHVHEVTADIALSHFKKTPIYRAFLDAQTQTHGDGDERPLVVIFSWPRVKGGRFMAIHEYGDSGVPGVKIVSTELDRRGQQIVLTVEPLAALLPLIVP